MAPSSGSGRRAGPPVAGLLVVGSLAVGSLVTPGAGAIAQEPPGPEPPVAFQDGTLTLAEAIRVALDRSPDVRQAVAAQASAHAARRADWGAFLPNASAGLSLSRSSFRSVTFPEPEGSAGRLEEPREGTTQGASQRFSLSWNLLEGGGRFARLRSGAAASRAADRRVAAAERSVVARVKERYYDALMQQRLAEAATRQLAGRREDLDVTRQRYELAAVTRSDLLGAEIVVADAELALLDARDQAAGFRRELASILGVEVPGEAFELADVEGLPDAAGLDAEALLSRALATDPSLGAAAAEAAAAAAGVWGARTGYLPDISLSYGLSRSETLGPEGDFFNFDLDNRARSFVVSVSWNLFDGFGRERAVAEAAASKRRAEAELLRQRLDLRAAVRNASEEIGRRAERLGIQERKLDLAAQRLELAREQYRLGTITYFDLQNAIRDLTDAELDVIQERYEYLKAWARLEERVGEPAGAGSSAP